MLAAYTVDETIESAVRSALKGRKVSRVLVEPTSDSWGDDAYRVTIVVDDSEELTGDEAGDTISSISRALQRIGDQSIAITSFATESEMTANGDPEL